MSSGNNIVSALVGVLGRVLSSGGGARGGETRRPRSAPRPRRPERGRAADAGRVSDTATIQVEPEDIDDVSVGYAPSRNGLPDSGEVIWTWVPYVENDGRGKDRPVLVIGRQSEERVYAVRMTSKAHDHDRDFLAIGSGEWDPQGRESWVDIEQLYSVHVDGMRREAAGLDPRRYDRVAEALIRRYGWARA